MDVFSLVLSMAITRKKISWKISGPMGVLPDLLGRSFQPQFTGWLMEFQDRVDDDTVTSDMPVALGNLPMDTLTNNCRLLYGCAYYFLKSKRTREAWLHGWKYLFYRGCSTSQSIPLAHV